MRAPDHHPTRREAEQLLDDPAAHRSALGTLLSAAAAPALPGELRREDAEVAAFRRARLAPSTATAGFVSPRRLASRAAARAVIATGAVVALTTGGFALANSAHLPGLPGQASDQATESVAKNPQPSTTSSTTAVAPGSQAPGSTSPGSETSGPESPGATDTGTSSPTPNVEGLCRAFQATDRSAHGSSLDSAAFTALAAAAGGADRVATWCVDLIGEPKKTGKPSQLPTPTTQPTGKPSTAPGKPTDKPTPTGKGGGRKP